MYPLTVGELEQSDMADQGLDRLFSADDPTPGALNDAPDLPEYLSLALRGGYPDAVNLSDYARTAWYEGYVDQLVRHDVAELGTVHNPQALTDLLRAVALNTAGTPTLTSLTEAASIDQRTAKTYLDLLEDLCVIERLPSWGVNRFNRMVKSPKYHIADPGMAAFLVGDDQAGLLTSADRMGRIIDTFVTSQLRPLLCLHIPSIKAFHLRDRNGDREVDMILESASSKIVGIEIKSANCVNTSSAKHLAWLRDELGPAFVRGFVLHTGSMTYSLGDKLWAMPIAKLWRA